MIEEFCKYYDPCGLIGWKSCRLHAMYNCSYEGDFNKCNMRNSILEKQRNMKEEEIKNMLSDIINNNAEYEGKPAAKSGKTFPPKYYLWKPYKLGDEVHPDWDYRKVETWYVVNYHARKTFMVINQETFHRHFLPNDALYQSRSEEDCEKWIADNISWIAMRYGEEDMVTDDIDANEIRVSAIKEFAEELLSRVQQKEDVKKVIREMGLRVWGSTIKKDENTENLSN